MNNNFRKVINIESYLEQLPWLNEKMPAACFIEAKAL